MELNEWKKILESGESLVTELEFKNREEYDEYAAQHKIGAGTEVTIGGATMKTGEGGELESDSEETSDPDSKKNKSLEKKEMKTLNDFMKGMTAEFNIDVDEENNSAYIWFTAENPDDGEEYEYNLEIAKKPDGTYEIYDAKIEYEHGGDDMEEFNGVSDKGESLTDFLSRQIE